MSINWDSLRATEFPVVEHWAYFDHAAVAPLPRRSGEALRDWVHDQERHGIMNWSTWGQKVDQARVACARLINAEVSEIAFITNTTSGIGLIAEGYPWKP